MSVAIVTRYLGPTNYRGSRIVATVPERIADRDRDRAPGSEGYALHQPAHWRLTIPYPYELSGSDVHRVAAEALRDRIGWAGTLTPGALPDGYAWTFDPAADILADVRRILWPPDGRRLADDAQPWTPDTLDAIAQTVGPAV